MGLLSAQAPAQLPPEPAHPSSLGMGLAGTGPWVLDSQVPWELLLPKWEEALKSQGTKSVHPPGGATQRGLQSRGPRPSILPEEPCGGVGSSEPGGEEEEILRNASIHYLGAPCRPLPGMHL